MTLNDAMQAYLVRTRMGYPCRIIRECNSHHLINVWFHVDPVTKQLLVTTRYADGTPNWTRPGDCRHSPYAPADDWILIP